MKKFDFTKACEPKPEDRNINHKTPFEFSSLSDSAYSPVSLFQSVADFTNRSMVFQNGKKDRYVFQLASNFNRAGIDQQTAELLIRAHHLDVTLTNEISNSVNEAYKNSEEHAIWTPDYVFSVTSVSSVASAREDVKNTPLIPDKVYGQLPGLLAKCTQVFDVPRERDVMLTSALTILSGCFPNVRGIYDKRQFYPNLFAFVVGPPVSGKGVMIYAKMLCQKVHEYHRNNASSNNGDTTKGRTYFIPADASAAAVKWLLMQNNGKGVICESEADTVSYTFQQDWGQYSDLMRKAFHHEPLTFSRMEDKRKPSVEEITNPKVSICLSGTPSQIPSLLNGIHDGLVSRIIFYSIKNDPSPVFKDVFSDSGTPDLTAYFEEMADIVHKDFYLKCSELGPVNFSLNKEQEALFVNKFRTILSDTHVSFGEETDATVYRLGLIAFRLAMLLTIIRKIEENDLSENIVCNDVDFETSIILVETYLQHALSIFKTILPVKSNNHTINALYDFLPGEFSYSEAVKIGKLVMGISEKSVSTYLKKLKEDGRLKQPKANGEYLKN